jgi:flagellar basal-body rod protein FlgB
MSDIFALASRQAGWLDAKRLAIANNVANANTPGYKAQDIQPFSDVLGSRSVALGSTHPSHFGTTDRAQERVEAADVEAWEAFHSGNNVNLDQEFLASGDVARQHALNTAIQRSFQRMFLASVKG